MSSELTGVLAGFDASRTPINELDVQTGVAALRKLDVLPDFDVRCELTAFGFRERRLGEKDTPDAWFLPMASGKDADGCKWESPDASLVDLPMLEYWMQRCNDAKHPVLRARYSGLIWAFHFRVMQKKPPIHFAHNRIDSILELSQGGFHKHDVDVFWKLRNALRFALQLNDKERVQRLRDSLLDFERKVATDGMAGLWGHSFDALIGNPKVPLSDEQRDAIIREMEDRLERLSNPETAGTALDPWGAEHAAMRLASYYRATDRPADTKRVLDCYRRAYEAMAAQANALQAQGWLEQVEEKLREFGLIAEASALRIRIRELGPGTNAGLAHVEHKMEVPREEMEAFINAILEGDRDAATTRFIQHYIPRVPELKAELQRLAGEAVIFSRMSHKLVDSEGRPIGTIGSLEDDPEGRLVHHMAFHISASAMFMHFVAAEYVSRFRIDTNTVMSWVEASPLFFESHRGIITHGLNAYFAREPILALHLLVPQIEHAIRRLIELKEGDVYRPNRVGGMDLRPLDDLLRDPIAQSQLGESILTYLRVLFTDRRGVNLRNYLCHGMLGATAFSMDLAHRVFHVLLLFSFGAAQRPENPPTKGMEGPTP